MDCSEETELIRKKLARARGVRALDFHILNRTVRVEYESDTIDEAALMELIDETGLRVSRGEHLEEAGFWERRGRHVLIGASGLSILIGGLLSWGSENPEVSIPWYLGGAIAGGYYIAKKALASLRVRSLDMNVLMSVAAIGAMAIGEWLEAAVVTFLFATAQLLESYSMEKARNAVRKLMDLSPALARVRRDGQEIEVSPCEVSPGEVLLVRPGERIALDGEILTGNSHVDQSPITGESKLVPKGPGSEVFAGTLNQQGFLEVRITKGATDTTLARIVHLVQEAGATKAPAQNFVDRFARVYTPAVIGLAVGMVTIPTLVFGLPFTEWFYRSLVMLVISCPCALVISTPVTIVSALASAARDGVLIKGGVYLEDAASLRAVVFDKTGTLTEGSLSVTEVIPVRGADAAEILGIAGSIEAQSEHHLARAIARAARENGAGRMRVEGFESLPGKGVRAVVNGRRYVLGSYRLIEEETLCDDTTDEIIEECEVGARTAVVLAGERGVLGIIVIADALREESKQALRELEALGIDRIVMLTGDNEGTARAIAAELGIHDYQSGLLPEEKVAKVRELLASHGKVAFVGDGVNDAPALATATVGIAMGGTGSDITLETSDITLVSGDLTGIPSTVRRGRRALRVIKQNITISLAAKLVFFALAVPGLATLWMAVGADMGASLIVIANGMKLLAREAASPNRKVELRS
jgi:Cd2+/Zn2+-exporting ATPase